LKAYPTNDISYLVEEHDLIAEMCTLLVQEDELPIENLHDIRNLIYNTKIENSVLNPEDVLKIFDSLRMFRLMKAYFGTRRGNYKKLGDKIDMIFENRLLEKHITEAIDDTGLIRDDATPELRRIRKSIQEKSGTLRSRLKKILRQVTEEEIATEDFFTIREGRFVLPIKPSHKRKMPGIIHGISQTGNTVFMEPSEIVEMNNDLSVLKSEEHKELYRIMANLTNEIGGSANEILQSIEIMGHIDAIWAKANYALEYGGVKPEIHSDNIIEIKKIRHPLLVHKMGKKKVIPMSIDFDKERRGHLISGPNAGGKTVALKSVGLNLAMALAGIFPLGEVRTNFRTIYSSIGDRQSIENDLSTFSSQITQLKQIIEECDKESLVLVDEIGSGTDPQEGAALACGILDTFININLFFIASTHQSSLKTYALNRDEIMNASLEFDEVDLKPTYNFMPGLPGNSYAFFLAKNVGLANHIIERSRGYLGSKQQELEESINQLSKYRTEALELKHKLQIERNEMEKLKSKYEEKLANIQQKREKMMDRAREEAAEIVTGANAVIEKAIKDVREEKKSMSEIKNEFEVQKNKVAKKIENKPQNKQENKKSSGKFEVGNKVTMDGSESTGEIISMSDGGKTALVEFNGLKFNVKTAKLTNVSNKEVRAIKRQMSTAKSEFSAETKLDLRGERAEPALRKVDEFISDAIVANLTNISIVHGKGTGALRHAVHDLLRTHPSIKNYRLGDLVEGGEGITIVEL
jgi:DNA mismatch repair protein MutS2